VETTIEKPWISAILSVGNKKSYNNNFKFVDEVIATSSKEDPDFLNKYNTVWESEEPGLNTND
jgi:predicted small integral membrane protein